MWRRAGEELITHRQAGEQQTDATRARLSSAQPGWREERTGMEREREWKGWEKGVEKRSLKAAAEEEATAMVRKGGNLMWVERT